MKNPSDNKIEVVVTAISGEGIVLETIPEKTRIYWPLKNIPQPLDIGNKLTLELQQDERQDKRGLSYSNSSMGTETMSGFSVPADPSNSAPDEKETKMRSLLEDLVN
jgi:hypothetical protein